jgi:hypothetical protein
MLRLFIGWAVIIAIIAVVWGRIKVWRLVGLLGLAALVAWGIASLAPPFASYRHHEPPAWNFQQ